MLTHSSIFQDNDGEFTIPRRSFSSAELIPAGPLPTEPRFPSITEDGEEEGGEGKEGEDEVDTGMVEKGERPRGDDWEMIDDGEQRVYLEKISAQNKVMRCATCITSST